MYEIWNYKATDKEIAECKGDYIGCEICRNVKRCLKLKLEQLEQPKTKHNKMVGISTIN